MNTKEEAIKLSNAIVDKIVEWDTAFALSNRNLAHPESRWVVNNYLVLVIEQLLADKRRLDGFEMLQCDIRYMSHSKRWKVGDNEPHESLRTAINKAMEKTK